MTLLVSIVVSSVVLMTMVQATPLSLSLFGNHRVQHQFKIPRSKSCWRPVVHHHPLQQQDALVKSSPGLLIRGGNSSWMNRLHQGMGATKARCWMVLGVAILIEIASTTLLNIATQEQSSSKLVLAMMLYMTSLFAFAISLHQIDVSIAYAVWSACGTALVSAVMITWFGESADPIKLSCLTCIILGVVGLNLRDTMM